MPPSVGLRTGASPFRPSLMGQRTLYYNDLNEVILKQMARSSKDPEFLEKYPNGMSTHAYLHEYMRPKVSKAQARKWAFEPSDESGNGDEAPSLPANTPSSHDQTTAPLPQQVPQLSQLSPVVSQTEKMPNGTATSPTTSNGAPISPASPDTPAADTTRQKMGNKRKVKTDDDDDRVLVGTRVDQNHANYVMAYNMLTGIRVTVSQRNAKSGKTGKDHLSNYDYEEVDKNSFDVTGNEVTPSAKYDFKFKDYAPEVFLKLRYLFGIDQADYLMSLTHKYILSELGSPGKSGSFFYFSRDYKYIIKTIHHSECKFLRKILLQYYNHVERYPDTMLSQFYGLHRVKMPYGRKVHFVIMNNIFPPHRDIHSTFDLKGSTIGRDYSEEKYKQNPQATLKDLNWLRRDMHLEFGEYKSKQFFQRLESDVAFLQKHKIMDYSLLVGVHDLKRGNEENIRNKTLQVFHSGVDESMHEIPEEAATQQAGAQGGSGSREPKLSDAETERRAQELRSSLRRQRPVPIDQTDDRMPESDRFGQVIDPAKFRDDDGGVQATREDNKTGDKIYYLGIIDCLTSYGAFKKTEHFLKGMRNDKTKISPIPPEPYGNRFLDFIKRITKAKK